MRKEMIALFFVVLLVISGCSGITGKGVADSDVDETLKLILEKRVLDRLKIRG